MKLLKVGIAFLVLISLQIVAAQWLNVPPPVAARMTAPFAGGGVPVVAGYTNYTSDASMVSYWMMEQATGADAPDGSASGNTLTHGSDSTGPTQSADHQQGTYSSLLNSAQSEVFSRTDTNLSAGFPGKDTGGNAGSMSVGLWIKMGESEIRYLIAKRLSDEYSFALKFDATNFIFQISSNGYSWTAVTGGTAITDDGSTWYHVVGVFNTDLNLIYLYVNGSSDAVAVSFTSAMFLGVSDLLVGPLSGRLDELFVMNRALSSTEVAEIYAHGLSGDR